MLLTRGLERVVGIRLELLVGDGDGVERFVDAGAPRRRRHPLIRRRPRRLVRARALPLPPERHHLVLEL
jgi:hypothetical protein